MNKDQAIHALGAGRKLTHRNFTPKEWMTFERGTGYIFEDGCVCATHEFWQMRSGPSWDDGWSIFEGRGK
jgi:hypothetical protein